MPFTLKEIVPWGRSFDEYLQMFALSESDLEKKILGCGDGPASFNSHVTRAGGDVVSIDPIYQFNSEDIQKRINEVYPEILKQLTENAESYVWRTISSPDELCRIRMKAMEEFLSDFTAGKTSGRYVEGELPDLPFPDNHFDLALSSHFLILYSDHISVEFHVRAIREMMRVATEVRIFPILSLGGTPFQHLDMLFALAKSEGWTIETKKVDYEFQKGTNEMLVIQRLYR